jgi:flagellar hook-associated protein 1 FlgK
MSAAINTALSGLEVFQAGINTVANNLANAQTPGYAQETVSTSTQYGQAGQPGTGATPPVIVRAAAGFAATQLRTANAANAGASAQSTTLTAISNALTNNGDVQTALNAFFGGIGTLAANPSSNAQRQTVLSNAQNVVSTFQSAAGNIAIAIAGASQTLSDSVTSANNLLQQLASINTSLTLSPNQPGLLDQQQNALNSLSSLLSISAIPQGSSGAVILASGGTILLDQSGAQTLTEVAATSSTAPSITAGANATPVPTTAADGAIGGAIANYAAGTAANQSLSALATIVATAVNTAQAQGLTPVGASGGALFSVPAPTVSASSSNTGSAIVTATISDSSALPTDGGPFLLTYNGTTWSAVDQASNVTYTGSGVPPSFAGITLSISGSPAAGDSFTLNPAPNAASGITTATTSAAAIAAADPYVLTPGTVQTDGSTLNSNAGSITANADSVVSTPSAGAATVPASYFGQTLQVNFTSATDYTVTTAADPSTTIATGTFSGSSDIAIAYPTTGAASGTYIQLPISGTPASGDTYTLSPGSASSGSNAARLAALFSSSNTTTTAGTLQDAAVGLSTGLGADAQSAQQLASATAAQVTTTTSNLQTVAGVNTDQQAVELTNYQQAYQAAAQVISTAHSLFESLLTAVGA